jgi:CRP/FNR family cyclic AMP-dependent transcriptional regulator
MTPMKSPKKQLPFDPKIFLATAGAGRAIKEYSKNDVIFAQGDPADSILYIQRGKVKMTVLSERGKEAVLAILGTHDFLGEGCLTGQPLRLATATALGDCALIRISRREMVRVLRDEPAFAEVFTAHLLTRIIRVEEDLVDQLFNSSEKRLARVLLLLANFGKAQKVEPIIPHISQEMLAEMVGTTRPRVTFFLNKFRTLGFIDYNGGLRVNNSLLSVVLHD